MNCFVCRNEARAHIVRGLRSSRGPGGWGRICVPCAVKHDLDGVLLSPPSSDATEEWLAHQKEKNSEA